MSMASRDPRADIVDSNPFPKPKIRRIHSAENLGNSSMYTMDELKNMFTNNSEKETPIETGLGV